MNIIKAVFKLIHSKEHLFSRTSYIAPQCEPSHIVTSHYRLKFIDLMASVIRYNFVNNQSYGHFMDYLSYTYDILVRQNNYTDRKKNKAIVKMINQVINFIKLISH